MDGTLINTIGDIKSAFNSALALEHLNPCSVSLAKQVVGRGLRNALLGLLEYHKHPVSDERFSFLYNHMMEYYKTHYADFSHPYPGIEALLKKLSLESIPIGILSNKEDVLTQKIVKKVLPEYSFAMVRGMVPGFPRKPDRAAIDLFCTQYHLSSDQMWYVGDSEVDYQTAKNADCPHILVSWGFRPKKELEALPDSVVVDTVRALEDAIYGIQ